MTTQRLKLNDWFTTGAILIMLAYGFKQLPAGEEGQNQSDSVIDGVIEMQAAQPELSPQRIAGSVYVASVSGERSTQAAQL